MPNYLKACYCVVVTSASIAYDYAGVQRPDQNDLSFAIQQLSDDQQYVVQSQLRRDSQSVRVAHVLEANVQHQIDRYRSGNYIAFAITMLPEKPASAG